MYPSNDVLAEVGRVTVAGSRLDLWMGFLWAHLDRDTDEAKVRREPGAVQQEHVRKLAIPRLFGDLQAAVLAAVDVADGARKSRNEIVHQDWVLRGPDATRPVGDFAHLAGEELQAYRIQWAREAKDSPDWQRVPRDSIEVVPALTLAELRNVEQALARATELVTGLTFSVASAREGGPPGGWLAYVDWAPYRTSPRVAKTA